MKTNVKYFNYRLLIAALFIGILLIEGCSSDVPKKDDPVLEGEIEQVVPNLAKSLFENEFAKAITVKLDPGQMLPFHPEPSRVLFALEDLSLEKTVDGALFSHLMTKGEANWEMGKVTSIKNTGKTTAKYLIIYRNSYGLPGVQEPTDLYDLGAINCEHANTLLENNHVKVMGVYLPAHREIPFHEEVNRMVYIHNLFSLKISEKPSSDATQVKTEERVYEPGDLFWELRGEQKIENTGESMAHFTVFGFKK